MKQKTAPSFRTLFFHLFCKYHRRKVGKTSFFSKTGKRGLAKNLQLWKHQHCDVNAADLKASFRDTDSMPVSESSSSSRAPTARELLAMNIVRLRKERGWSQEDLALESGLHRTFVAHVERQVRNISIDNIERLANALQIDVHVLLLP